MQIILHPSTERLGCKDTPSNEPGVLLHMPPIASLENLDGMSTVSDIDPVSELDYLARSLWFDEADRGTPLADESTPSIGHDPKEFKTNRRNLRASLREPCSDTDESTRARDCDTPLRPATTNQKNRRNLRASLEEPCSDADESTPSIDRDPKKFKTAPISSAPPPYNPADATNDEGFWSQLAKQHPDAFAPVTVDACDVFADAGERFPGCDESPSRTNETGTSSDFTTSPSLFSCLDGSAEFPGREEFPHTQVYSCVPAREFPTGFSSTRLFEFKRSDVDSLDVVVDRGASFPFVVARVVGLTNAPLHNRFKWFDYNESIDVAQFAVVHGGGVGGTARRTHLNVAAFECFPKL
jgi:hypothetical protein